jgi:hypothetical protein
MNYTHDETQLTRMATLTVTLVMPSSSDPRLNSTITTTKLAQTPINSATSRNAWSRY